MSGAAAKFSTLAGQGRASTRAMHREKPINVAI
jgi:hypothetical protein